MVEEYKCRFCPAVFSTPRALRGHHRSHRSENIDEKIQETLNLPAKRVALPSPREQEKRIAVPENERQVGGRGYGVSNLQPPLRFPSSTTFTVLPTGLAPPQTQRPDIKNLDPELLCRAPKCYPVVSSADTQQFQPQAQYLFIHDPRQFEQQLDNDMLHFPAIGSPDNFKGVSQHNLVNSSSSSLPSVVDRGAGQFQQMDQNSQSTQNVLNPSQQFQQERDNSDTLSFDEILESKLDWHDLWKCLDNNSQDSPSDSLSMSDSQQFQQRNQSLPPSSPIGLHNISQQFQHQWNQDFELEREEIMKFMGFNSQQIQQQRDFKYNFRILDEIIEEIRKYFSDSNVQ
ncbi:uncharacterized protein LOC131063164 isoform X1 [Cryptomeria japonica]|uniref:uncharacterized protein LOC131063164 isoform X1 n=1 Tax=Cryptomeria japonica TaxID=3369 RepID=UPI0025AC4434|nr:uncharacterized protein LOC131063164 isoform X1 [Cryptomeria japonica]XP_057852925.1 uncharacterized protein LOC131063164 isoform X1 [Cryptomeria japonica]